MPAQVFGAQATAVELYIAFYGAAPSNPIYNNLLAVTAASSPQALALTIGNQFATTSDADLAKMVLTNLGISAATTNQTAYDALLAGLTAAFTAYPTARGLVVLNLANILTTLETNATYGAASQAFNQTVTTAYVYASNPANTQTQTTSGITTATPLTVNAGDVVNGTSGNDSINGNLFFNAPSGTFFETLNSGDAINGGAGTDTLNLGFNTGGTISPAALTSIENISVNQITAATTVDMTNGTGLATLTVANSTAAGDLTLSNTGTLLTSLTMSNAAGDVVIGSTTAAVAGTADSIAVNLSQVSGAALVSLAGYETLNVASSGPATNSIALATAGGVGYSASATVKVTGTTSATISTGGSVNAITIDGSGMTGTAVLSVTANAAANNVNVTGTANNDTVTLGAFYTTSDTVNGGAGSDTLSVTTAMAQGVSANQTNLSNLEVLSISDILTAGATYTPASFGGATAFTLGAGSAGAFNVNYAAGTDTLNLGATATGGLATLSATGSSTSDILNINAGTATSASLTNGAVTTVGFETVNLNSNAALGNTNTFGAFTLTGTAAQEVLNVTGARNLTLGAVTADQINASAMTGNLVMTAASISASVPASGLQITGGSGNDTLFGAAGADIINGGAGNDRILVGAAGAANQGDILSGGAGADQFRFDAADIATLTKMSTDGAIAQIVKITDFVAGTDKIALVNGAAALYTGVTMNTAVTVATANDLATVAGGAAGIAASAAGGIAHAVMINVTAGTQAGTYLFINDATAGYQAGNDMLINITGVTGTITSSDFVLSGA